MAVSDSEDIDELFGELRSLVEVADKGAEAWARSMLHSPHFAASSLKGIFG